MGGAVRVGICVGVLVAAMSGCGVGAGPSPPDVRAELLNLGDLPPGWDLYEPAQTTTTVPTSQQILGCPAYNKLFGPRALPGTLADAQEGFLSDTLGANLSEELGTYPGPPQAVTAYDQVVDENRGCRSGSETMGNGDVLTITGNESSLPTLGQGSAAFVYDVANPTAKAYTESGVAIAMRGDQVIVVGYSAGSSSPTAGLVRYGRLALQKLR